MSSLVELVFAAVGADTVATSVTKIAEAQRALAKAVADTGKAAPVAAVAEQAATAAAKVAKGAEQVAAASGEATAAIGETDKAAKVLAVDLEAVSRQVAAAVQRLNQLGSAAQASAGATAAAAHQVPTTLAGLNNAGIASEAAFQRQQRAAAAAAQSVSTVAVPAYSRLRDNIQELSSSVGERLSGLFDAQARQLLALGAAALSVRAIYSGLKSAVGDGAEFLQMSRRVGEGVRELVVLDQAYRNAGLGAGSLERSANMLQRVLSSNGDTLVHTRAALRLLGTSIEELQPLRFGDQLRVLERGFSGIENPAQRAAVAIKLFGETGGQMLQLFGDGSALATAEQQAGRLGDRMAQNAATFQRVEVALGTVSVRLKEMWAAAASQLVPTLETVASLLSGMNFSGLGAFLGAAGPGLALSGGLLASGLFEKLDLAALNFQERLGKGAGSALAGSVAKVTGVLANVMPLGLAAAIVEQIVTGIIAASVDKRLQQQRFKVQEVGSTVGAAQAAVQGVKSSEDAARVRADIARQIAELQQQVAALEERKRRAEAAAAASARAGGVPVVFGLSDADAQKLEIARGKIAELRPLMDGAGDAAVVASTIAQNRLQAIKAALAPLVADMEKLEKKNAELRLKDQTPIEQVISLQAQHAKISRQLEQTPDGLTDDEQKARRLKLENDLLEVEIKQRKATEDISAQLKKHTDEVQRRALFEMETQLAVARAAGKDEEAAKLQKQIALRRALYELTGADLQLAKQRIDAEDKLAAAAVAQKKAREQMQAERTALDNTLTTIRENVAKLDADYTRTDAAKWSDRRRAIDEEIKTLQAAAAADESRAKAARASGDPDSEKLALQYDASAQSSRRGLASAQGERTRMGPDPNNWIQQTQKSLTDLLNQVGTTAQRIGRSIASTIGGAFDSASQHITGVIVGTESIGRAASQIGLNIEQSIVGAIVDMGVRWVEQMAIMGAQWIATKLGMAAADKGVQAASTAALIPIAAAQSAIWAGPAALATIASFGEAAALAPGQVVAAKLATIALAGPLAAARTGGYFPGEDDKVAGVFHGNEFIFSAPAVRAIGAENLAAQHSAALRGAAAPASFGASSAPAAAAGGDGPPSVHVYLDKSAYLRAIATDLRGIAHEVYDQRDRK